MRTDEMEIFNLIQLNRDGRKHSHTNRHEMRRCGRWLDSEAISHRIPSINRYCVEMRFDYFVSIERCRKVEARRWREGVDPWEGERRRHWHFQHFEVSRTHASFGWINKSSAYSATTKTRKHSNERCVAEHAEAILGRPHYNFLGFASSKWK